MKLNNRLFFSIALFAFIFLTGCKKNIINFNKKHQVLPEAKFYDIPFPLNYKTSNIYNDSTLKIIAFQNIDDINSFYQEEMINLGWRLNNDFVDSEVNLIFEKPYKFVLISLRPINVNQCEVNFFTKSK